MRNTKEEFDNMFDITIEADVNYARRARDANCLSAVRELCPVN